MKGKVRKFAALGNGPTVLFVLSLLFFISIGLRVADDVRWATAFASNETLEPFEGDSCEGFDTAGVAAALEAIRAREVELEETRQSLADRIAAVEVAEATTKSMLAELQAAEESLLATMARSSEAAEEDLSRLTSVYENMKPKEAAPVFDQMAPEFAAGFLGRMRPDAAAAILAGLEPEKAYTISVLLAGRNAAAPTE